MECTYSKNNKIFSELRASCLLGINGYHRTISLWKFLSLLVSHSLGYNFRHLFLNSFGKSFQKLIIASKFIRHLLWKYFGNSLVNSYNNSFDNSFLFLNEHFLKFSDNFSENYLGYSFGSVSGNSLLSSQNYFKKLLKEFPIELQKNLRFLKKC